MSVTSAKKLMLRECSMLDPEVRYPCPVCLGVQLSKIPIPKAKPPLVLDRCQRCGGIWFDEGETTRLRNISLGGVRQRIKPSDKIFRMPCHSCQVLMDRNAEKCPACGWKNVLDCPVCTHAMSRRQIGGLHLDFCAPCRGVWFDQIELTEIWNLRVQAPEPKTRSDNGLAQGAAHVAADVGLEILFWHPELAVWAGEAVVAGTRGAASGIAHVATEAPEVIGVVAEATGDLAGTVFEVIADIVGSVFS